MADAVIVLSLLVFYLAGAWAAGILVALGLGSSDRMAAVFGLPFPIFWTILAVWWTAFRGATERETDA